MYLPFLFLILVGFVRALPSTDYIVIGSGTAGCALAARLCSRLAHRQVTLLERATPLNASERLLVSAPRLTTETWNTRLVETFETAPNPGLNGRTDILITGNALGGSSSINSGQWNIPPLAQVARWGFQGLTAFRAAVLYARAEDRIKPMQPPQNLRQELGDEWLSAAEKVGLPILKNPFDGRRREGVFSNFLTVSKVGRRNDACTAYLKPVMNGKCKHNLRLIEGATVTKLLLTPRSRSRRTSYKCKHGKCQCLQSDLERRRRVRGIEYMLAESMSTKQVLRARKQVIVSAGPIGSPKLLQMSGIGPRDVLKKADIPLLHKLPVGKKVQSRSLGLVISAYTGRPTVRDNNPDEVLSVPERMKFMSGEGGLLGKAVSGVNGRFGRDFYLLMTNSFSVRDESAGQPLFLSTCLGQPKSFGRISVTGSNPLTAPRLALDFLGGSEEAARLVVCLKKLRDLHAKFPESLQADEVTPGSTVPITEALVRNRATSAYHVVGGCAVGRVVDADFKVKDLDGVRVVDSSVIPQMPRQAGPMASVYMLAELAADLIQEEERC